MRARYPDKDGYVDRDGVKVFYEVYENDGPTIVFLPTWQIVHSRSWKMQVPYFSRYYRVVTFDARGSGKSDRPAERHFYDERHSIDDALAVMDATGTDTAVFVGVSHGGRHAIAMASDHPERTLAIVTICPGVDLGLGDHPDREFAQTDFAEPLETYEGWAKSNMHYWLEDYPDYARFLISQIFTEPYSTKPIEDFVGWASETTGEVLVNTRLAKGWGQDDFERMVLRVRCPALHVHGTADSVRHHNISEKLAELTGGELVLFEGSGHAPQARDPAKFNTVMKRFLDTALAGTAAPTPPPALLWARGLARKRKALYLSSPIGLGHARRDVAIAQELHRTHPDLEIDWLAQHPVTTVLEAEGETIHPASRFLANESSHIASEADDHDLHCFQALRRMDEILLANFTVFQEVVDEGDYDVIVGDEAWDVDYYWHENPELKRGVNVWMTDFVGFLPMPSGGEHEAFLTADYNAEMINHIARFPRVRDRGIFVGNPDDVVDESFGPDLPMIRDWTNDHFTYSGYITGFDPTTLDREQLRSELGYGEDEKVCIVTVGGSGVGSDLIRRVLDSYPAASRQIPGLRMIVVAGPRIDPNTLPLVDGVEVHSYVERLYRHLAVCDIAIAQGGLTTTMELVASRTPFLYFPLRNHFEQNFHVRHRLDRYRAGRYMDYDAADPDAIADALVDELAREVDYAPVETDGAKRAAQLIAELL